MQAYVNGHSNFRIMNPREWFINMRDNKESTSSPTFFGMEILNRFDKSADATVKARVADTNFMKLAQIFKPDARQNCVKVFLKFVTMSGTLCGWLGAYEKLTANEYIDVTKRFLSDIWGTDFMPMQSGPDFCAVSMWEG